MSKRTLLSGARDTSQVNTQDRDSEPGALVLRTFNGNSLEEITLRGKWTTRLECNNRLDIG